MRKEFGKQLDFSIAPGGRIHMIGIGGASMSGLALMLQQMGYHVTGSNNVDGAILDRLREKGIRVCIGHTAENAAGADLVVYTTAVADNNPELDACRRMRIPVLDRPTLLGYLSEQFRQCVAVCGTHGKTTTTAMLAEILVAANVDPTIHIGGQLDSIDGNIRMGQSDLFLTEACEYRRGCLHLHPTMGIILNIAEDHMDCYDTIQEIEDAFRQFMELLPSGGTAIGNGDDPRIVRRMEQLSCRTLSFGWDPKCDYQPAGYREDEQGYGRFDLVRGVVPLGTVSMSVPGRFNVYNALAALAAADALGLDMKQACEAISGFQGARRRFELTSVTEGVEIFHDYGHNPEEIRNAISIARIRCRGKLWAVVQPHTFSRVRALFDDYLTCTEEADVTLLTDIYAAREKDPGDLDSGMLAEGMRSRGIDARWTPAFADVRRELYASWQPGDLVITLGCGNINQLNEELK